MFTTIEVLTHSSEVALLFSPESPLERDLGKESGLKEHDDNTKANRWGFPTPPSPKKTTSLAVAQRYRVPQKTLWVRFGQIDPSDLVNPLGLPF